MAKIETLMKNIDKKVSKREKKFKKNLANLKK
jgi:hypothetical protein